MPTPGTHELGPQHGAIRVHTYREGAASMVGHNLIIAVEVWDGRVTITADGTPAAVELNADSTSMKVLDGHQGVKPLSDKDRREIAKTIEAKVLRGAPIVFRSDAVQTQDGTVTVSGALTLVEVTRPATFDLQLGSDGRLQGTVALVQSEWGIKPYKAMLGALRVRDDIEIALDVRLPGG